MTQRRSRPTGRIPGVASALGSRDAHSGPTSLRQYASALLLRPTAPPLTLGLGAAALLIAAESVLVYLLKEAVPRNVFGVVFLLGVLAVAALWGFGLGAVTSVASAVVYAGFHHRQTGGSLVVTWVAVTVFLLVALAAATIAGVARSRAVEADLRRRQVETVNGKLGALADQQAALRRVATLVARGALPAEVFSAVAVELSRCLGGYYHSVLFRYEPDGTAVLLAVGLGDAREAAVDDVVSRRVAEEATRNIGARFPLEGDNVSATVFRTSRPARMVSYDNASGSIAERFRSFGLRTAVGAPVIVDGRLWGVAIVGSLKPDALPSDTEERIADFTDLVGTAIANAQARAELGVLAEQQAALRRVATLVAQGASPSEVFSAVALELAGVLGVQNASMWRYESDDAAELLSSWDEPGAKNLPVGQRFPLAGENIATMVLRTGRPARMNSHEHAGGPAAGQIRELGLHGGVGAPIIVDGGLWGVAVVGTSRTEPLPPDTEARVGDFADLVSTAIANAQTHAELTASRVRIVTAADEARRRIERDLHDGAQQRLVSLGLELRTAEASVPPELQPLKDKISQLVTNVVGVSTDLQELSRGIHPAILSKGGLGPALKTLARRSAVPVELDLGVTWRLSESAEVATYYVVAEALTNVAKHARASVVRVSVEAAAGSLRLSIEDDGVGGVDTGNGSGLIGLTDRVEAIGGRMTVCSRPGQGTSLFVTIPLDVP
jgi:signal transduction histidine kinase